jgi:hypothetical protein
VIEPEGGWPIAAPAPTAPKPRISLPIAGAWADTKRILRLALGPMIAASLLGYAVSITVESLSVAGRSFADMDPAAAVTLLGLELVLSIASEIALVRLAAQAWAGEVGGLGHAYGFALWRFLPFAATYLVAAAITSVGLVALVVPGLIAIAALAFWRQAVVMDGLWGTPAAIRSARLARPVLGRLLLLLVAVSLLRFAFVDPIAMLAQGSQVPWAVTFMKENARAVDGLILGVVLWRVVVDPTAIAFVTSLYARLSGASAPALEGGDQPPFI